MAFDGNGTFNLLYTWATEAASPPIAISKLDGEMAGVATALSTCLLRNGGGKPTADIDWNAKKLTNLADATAATDALNRQTADARYALTSEGSFTMELATDSSGGSVLTSGTAYWKKIGDTAIVRMPPLYATTADSTLYLRAIPAAIQPVFSGITNTQAVIVSGYVNGNRGVVEIDIPEGQAYWTLKGLTADFDTNSNNKGVGTLATILPTITYHTGT